MIKMENKSVVTTAYAVRHFIVLQEIFEAATPMRFGVIAGALRAAKRFKCIRGNFLQLPHCALGILRESLPTLTKFGQVLVVGILECFICNRCFHIKNGEQLVATNVAALRGRTFAVLGRGCPGAVATPHGFRLRGVFLPHPRRESAWDLF